MTLVHSAGAANPTYWDAMPQALTELVESTASRVYLDLSNQTHIQLQVPVTTASTSANSPAYALQYSLDTGSTWNYMCADSGPACSLSTAGTIRSGFLPLVQDARAEVLLRIVGRGGDGAASPAFGQIQIQLPVGNALQVPETRQIVQGDDYSAAEGRSLDYADLDGAWPDLSDATALTCSIANDVAVSGAATLLDEGEVVQSVRVELTAAQTDTLRLGKHAIDIQATLLNGHVITLVLGKLDVVADVTEAEDE